MLATHDPQAPEVARLVSDLIRSVLPEMEVEHIGSTAVPECRGKGYIDVMVLYPDGALETVDARLREEYVAEKQRVLAAGVFDSVDYAIEKGGFVQRVLATREARDNTKGAI